MIGVLVRRSICGGRYHTKSSFDDSNLDLLSTLMSSEGRTSSNTAQTVWNTHRRKRKFMDTLLRMSSHPHLPKFEAPQAAIEPPAIPRSASCGDLDSPGLFSLRSRSPHSNRLGLKRQINVTVEGLPDAKKVVLAKVDYFQELPDELKLRVFGYLKPKELVQASLVRNSNFS